MTYAEIVEAIQKLDDRLDAYYHCYRNLRDELTRLDEEIMRINKKKWLLEKQLFSVTKCKPATEPRKVTRVKKSEKEVDLKDLSMDEIIRVLKQLKSQGA